MSFIEFPTNAQAPLFGVELDRVFQQPAQATSRILVIGQMASSGGTATPGQHYAVRSADEGALLFGRRSQLARSLKRLFAGYPTATVRAVGLAAAGGGVAAVYTVSFSGTAEEDGTATIYIAGQRTETSVTEGDTASDIATAFLAVHDAMAESPFTASRSGAVVTLTARQAGSVGNVSIRANHRGIEAGEALPSPIEVTVIQTVAGATNPDISDAFAAVADEPFRYVFFPWTMSDATTMDSDTLDAVQSAMETRWGPTQGLRGHAFCGMSASLGDLATAGAARTSDSHITMFGFESDCASPAWELAAAALAEVAQIADQHAARPARGQRLHPGSDMDDVLLGSASPFDWSDRNTLYAAGVSPVLSRGWQMFVERVKCLYSTNPTTGLPDRKFSDVTTMLALCEVVDRLHNAIASAYPAHIICDDGVPVRAGIPVVRPSDIRATVLSVYQRAQFEALTAGLEDFTSGLVVERDPDNANRINYLAPLRIVAPLYQVAGLARVAQVG